MFFGHFQLPSLPLSSPHPCYLLVREFRHSVGAVPGRDQSHCGTNFAGVHYRVCNESLRSPERIAALQQPALLPDQHQCDTDTFAVRYEASSSSVNDDFKFTSTGESQFRLKAVASLDCFLIFYYNKAEKLLLCYYISLFLKHVAG